MSEQQNLIVAVTLSILILLGFHFFYDRPRQAEAQKIVANKDIPLTTSKSDNQGSVKRIPRVQAVTSGQRVPIHTNTIKGSINLQGGVIDDISLLKYHESVESKVPVDLLSPSNTESPYYVHNHWRAVQGGTSLPSKESLWTFDGQKQDGPNVIYQLSWKDPKNQIHINRTITIDDKYLFTIQDQVTNHSSSDLKIQAVSDIVRVGTPITSGYYILHEGPLGVLNGKLNEYEYKKLEKEKSIKQESSGGWLGITDKYWLVAHFRPQDEKIQVQYSVDQTPDEKIVYTASLAGQEVVVAPGSHKTSTHYVFAGAKTLKALDFYEEAYKVANFDLAVDFGWFYFITKPLFYMMEKLYEVLGNFGLAILVLTVIAKLIFFPLANKSYRSMGRMKDIQPRVEALKAKYANDKLRFNQELMALYQKEKVNPMSGCLPMLIQAPIFFCLYKVLFVTIEMRHAPFYGWIHDLSAPDPTTIFNLFGLIHWNVPGFLNIGAWPLLMGLTMVVQQKMNPQPTDPVQAKMMLIMPVMLTYLLSGFPAGLVIYWAWSNILSMIQQGAMTRISSKVN